MVAQVDWNTDNILHDRGVYRARFKLNPNVLRVPIVPGSDPRQASAPRDLDQILKILKILKIS